MKKTLVSFRKQEKNKALSEEFKSSLKELVTDNEKKYKVNIIEGEENSKQALFTLEKLDKLLKESKEVKDVLVKELKDTEIVLRNLLIASVTFSLTSIIFYFASIAIPILGVATLASTASSTSLWIAYLAISNRKDDIINKLKDYDKIFGKNSDSNLIETVVSKLKKEKTNEIS